jgi:dipeptide/tripeptide permease
MDTPTQSTEEPKVSIWKQFPSAFWAANVMEIFERMGWYGFYAVSSLYLTGAVVDGGLGLSSEDCFPPCSGRWLIATVFGACSSLQPLS